MSERIIVFGAGGHARVVIDAIQRQGRYQIAFIADANELLKGSCLAGYEVKSEAEAMTAASDKASGAIIAIGNNAARSRLAEALVGKGFSLFSVVHPAAVVALSASIGAGTLIMPGSIINADTHVGDNVIINTAAIVEHECMIGDHVHIGPNATLCGGVAVGAGTLVGAGATVLTGVRVGARAIIGAGATVLHDIPDGATAVGSPCRILERKS